MRISGYPKCRVTNLSFNCSHFLHSASIQVSPGSVFSIISTAPCSVSTSEYSALHITETLASSEDMWATTSTNCVSRIFSSSSTVGLLVQSRKKPPMVTWDQFSSAITKNGFPTPTRSQFDRFTRNLGYAGISDKREAAMFLAQIAHESGGLQFKEQFGHKKHWYDFTNKPRKRLRRLLHKGVSFARSCLFEFLRKKYFNFKSLQIEPNSYCRMFFNYLELELFILRLFWYFGRGYIQLTGKDNYRRASKDLYGDDRLVRNPDLVAKDEDAAFFTAGWYWKNKVARRPEVKRGMFGAATRAINGGLECNGSNLRSSLTRFRYYRVAYNEFGLRGKPDERGCYN
ncbi:unnamed protein product [Nezara viridula]|uniref:Glycoside hydrolase family 19 catalytic domain-containing protein n=1 Tax=Nezara viridula TaxID=85310 RepID=A0A9P0MMP9_NEZVI|nr:unnamed protein product [Nezara viridula]